MLEASCSDEPNQTPSALSPNKHIFLDLQAAAHVQMRARLSSDATQINIYPLKLDVPPVISTS